MIDSSVSLPSHRFRVYKDMIRPEKLDRSVSLYGADYIDVPALSRRDYNLHFYSFKECSILAKVRTVNYGVPDKKAAAPSSRAGSAKYR